MLRGVLVGAGYFAGFQAEAWTRVAGARIVAVADAQPDRAREFAARWKIPAAYSDVEEALRHEKPDFVDIATRPDSHRALAELAARHGVHVVCQKPLAPTWGESLALVESCERAGVRLVVHENWRWQPWYREVKRLLDAGFFGRPFHAEFKMRVGDGRGPEPFPQQPYFREMPSLMVYETAVHFIDTLRFLLGEIRSVFCRTARVNPVLLGEDYFIIQMSFASGANGLVDGNRTSGPAAGSLTLGTFQLEGERAMARLSPDGRLWVTEYGGEERPHEFPTSDQGYKGDSVRAMQQHFVDCLKTARSAESEGREYLKTVAAVFACYTSAAQESAVTP